MQLNLIKTVMISLTLLLSVSLSLAVENKTDSDDEAPRIVKPKAKSTKANKAPAPAKVKLVDINRASKEELKTLPGIGDSEADNIIAGRPYLSKAHLVTHSVIPSGIYEGLKRRVVAKQK